MQSENSHASDRHILVIAHTGRAESLTAAISVCRQLIGAGIVPVLSPDSYETISQAEPDLSPVRRLGNEVETGELELVIVLGGDGTILRAAELTRGCSAPLLGVNLGHVGFLAESEREELTSTVERARRAHDSVRSGEGRFRGRLRNVGSE